MTGAINITIARDLLHSALAKVARVARAKSKIHILQNLLIRLDPGALTVVATDLDMEIRATVAAEHGHAGEAITVYADLFSRLVNDFPPHTEVALSWATGDNKVEIKCGRSRFKVNSLPAEDFPMFPDVSGAVVTIPAGDLRRAFATLSYAICTEVSRIYLCGIYLHHNASQLMLVATNGHKLARMRLPRPSKANEFGGVIIPQSTVNEVLRLVDTKAEGDVELTISQSGISFSSGQTVLRSKLIDGTYPDYVRVIPQDNTKVVVVDLDDMVAAIGRVRVMADRTEGESRSLKLSFVADGVTISTHNVDAGEGEEFVATEYEGEPFSLDIGFQGGYIAATLASLGTGAVRMKLADPGSPALFEGVGREEADLVLMPLRV